MLLGLSVRDEEETISVSHLKPNGSHQGIKPPRQCHCESAQSLIIVLLLVSLETDVEMEVLDLVICVLEISHHSLDPPPPPPPRRSGDRV